MKLLDLFCGAGGAAMGYHRAGFDEVVGVDLHPQPNYPFEFIQDDAFSGLRRLIDGEFGQVDLIHASPPCQGYSVASSCRPGLSDTYPQFIDAIRSELRAIGIPWVIENVAGARDSMIAPIVLCGAMFGAPLYRHRLFETASHHILKQPKHPKHVVRASRAGHWEPGTFVSVAGNCAPIEMSEAAMGITWMTRHELAESIPPIFTEYIGREMIRCIREREL